MKLRHVAELRRHFGSRWLAQRAYYAMRLRAGGLRRRTPLRPWQDAPPVFIPGQSKPADADSYFQHRQACPPPFFFSPDSQPAYAALLREFDGECDNPVLEADALERGEFQFFDHHQLKCGVPPNWHRNAFTGSNSPADRHWSTIGDFDNGDIKVVWEPSRFGFVYPLVRAYWRTADERYPRLFWLLLEDWRENNQPHRGANWKCGQEAAFRAMAWCFALFGFWNSPATTPSRAFELARMLGFTAERIDANIDYALGQANNHGISEAVGLWTIGTLFPEFESAKHWQEHGRRTMEAEARRLIYDDGAFSQHSLNYHRLMLQDYVWSLRLADLHGIPMADDLRERIARAAEFAFQLQDETSGAVPNYGHNDGALILPLNNCGFRDFRPVISASRFLTRGVRTYEPGPWDEDLVWLFGPDSLRANIKREERKDLRADTGGYYTLRSDAGFAFMRCARFRHRPAQADMLHFDLWWHGQNIALDAGTYSYNAPEPWFSAFSGTRAHNTVSIDGHDQMERAGKFLWLPWLHGDVRFFLRTGSLAYLECEHDGYSRLAASVKYRRGIVQLDAESWLVLDHLESREKHDYRLHWLFPDVPHEFSERDLRMSLRTDAGPYYVRFGSGAGLVAGSLVRADATTARGWSAPYYAMRQPALSVALEQNATNVTFWTLFSPKECTCSLANLELQIRREDQTSVVQLAAERDASLVRSVQVPGHGELRVAV
jgi:asparagine synthase (glutamine-hydrolysing)